MPRGKYIRTPEMIARYREGARNRVYTEEGRRKRRESLAKRANPPALGKTWKVKSDVLHKFRGRIPWNKGQLLSSEYRNKISQGKMGCKAWNKGVPLTEPYRTILKAAGLKGIQKQQKQHKSSIEIKCETFLSEIGIECMPQALINDKFLVDFYLPDYDCVIECDGDYWHSRPEVIARDKAKNAYLLKCGYKLPRIPEYKINSGEFKSIILDAIKCS